MKKNVLEWLEDSKELYPDKTAYKDAANELTFEEVYGAARLIGSGILAKEVSEAPVAVMMGRSVYTIVSYLGVVAFSGFNNSERFLLPAIPGLIAMWSYGVSVLREKSFKLLTPWCFVVFAMEFAWAYFKLGSRGLF